MAKTPLSIAVPLDGTDHELGLRQLQRYVSSKPTIRSQYRRFRGPFLEYLTLEDLRNRLKSWEEFFIHQQGDSKRPIDTYSVPGSVVALCERIDENLIEFIVNYIQVVLMVVLMVLGLWRGILCSALGLSYVWLRDPDWYLTEPWEQLRIVALQFVYPFVGVLLTMLTWMAVYVVSGILTGVFLVLLHAGCRRSPTELRYKKQPAVVRWLRRGRAPAEGAAQLRSDVQRYLKEARGEFHSWLQWRMLHVRDILGLMRLTLMQKLQKRWNKKTVSLVS